MHLIQTHIEVLLVLMAKSMPEMFRKSLILELQEGSVVSFRKPYRYVNLNALSYNDHLICHFDQR